MSPTKKAVKKPAKKVPTAPATMTNPARKFSVRKGAVRVAKKLGPSKQSSKSETSNNEKTARKASSKPRIQVREITLENSLVERAGSTADKWEFGTTTIFADVSSTDNLHLKFSIESAGGGITDVQIGIDYDDLERILKVIAKLHPEKIGLFLAATAETAKGFEEKIAVVSENADYWHDKYYEENDE